MKILLSAGEVSGDRIGAELARALRARFPGVELAGAAGPLMRAEGVRSLCDAQVFAHAGWASVARALPGLFLAGAAYLKRARAFAPDAVVAIDAPGLNGILLDKFRHLGEARTWIAPPQLWAWKDRQPSILRGMVVHPLHEFEVPALESAGARVSWLGFPVESSRRRDGPRDRVALFPGSRPAWRRQHAALFLEAARLAIPGLEPVFAFPGARGGDRELGVARLEPREALSRAAVGLCLPGSATLDLALEGVPAVVAARPTRFDAWLAGRRLQTGAVGLPNRILNLEVYPEIVDPRLAADDLLELLRRAADLAGWDPRLDGFRDRLGSNGAAGRMAASILERVRPAG